jgi:hypothetical protein
VTFPPVDEPSQQRRAAVYGRANQASTHYRPLRKGRPSPDPAPVPTSRAAKAANRRRFVLFVVALLVAIAFGTAIFGVVLASPAPVAQAPGPARVMPEPATQPPPPTGRGTATELAPPSTGTSGAPENTTAPRRVSTTKPAAGAGGEDSRPAPSPTFTYQNCNKARRAGAAPLHPGDPGYSAKLDKDGNGIACDEKEEKGRG